MWHDASPINIASQELREAGMDRRDDIGEDQILNELRTLCTRDTGECVEGSGARVFSREV